MNVTFILDAWTLTAMVICQCTNSNISTTNNYNEWKVLESNVYLSKIVCVRFVFLEITFFVILFIKNVYTRTLCRCLT